jgi:hypothetical protein
VSCPERKENEEAEVRDVKDATADDLPGFDALVGAAFASGRQIGGGNETTILDPRLAGP